MLPMLQKNTKEKRSLSDSIHLVKIKLNWSIRKSDISIDFSKKKGFQNFLDRTSRIGMSKIYIIKMAVTKMDFLLDADSVAVWAYQIVSANQRPRSEHQFQISTFKSINSQGLEAFWKPPFLYFIFILLQFTCIFI